MIRQGPIDFKKVGRDKQKLLLIRATVSAMSPQKLAAGISNCDPVREAGELPKQRSTLCSEINRALDEQRLQIVEVRPVVLHLPLLLPPLRLRKAEIVPLPPPDDPGSRVMILAVSKTG